MNLQGKIVDASPETTSGETQPPGSKTKHAEPECSITEHIAAIKPDSESVPMTQNHKAEWDFENSMAYIKVLGQKVYSDMPLRNSSGSRVEAVFTLDGALTWLKVGGIWWDLVKPSS